MASPNREIEPIRGPDSVALDLPTHPASGPGAHVFESLHFLGDSAGNLVPVLRGISDGLW